MAQVLEMFYALCVVLFCTKFVISFETVPQSDDQIKKPTSKGREKEELAKFVAPKYLVELLKMFVAEEKIKGVKSPVYRIVRGFLARSSLPLQTNRLSFDLRDVKVGEKITKAELFLFKRPGQLQTDPVMQRFCRVEILNIENGKRECVRSMSSHGRGWKSFNLSETVQKWHRQRNSLNKIEIRIQGNEKKSIQFFGADSVERKPFLVVFTESESKLSLRPDEKMLEKVTASASVPQRERFMRSEKVRSCNRTSLVVNMHDIGWERHVLAPDQFNIYRCEGKCRMFVPQSVKRQTNHAVIQAILANLGKTYNGRAVQSPCCSPISFEPIALLIHRKINGQSFIRVEDFEDMAIKDCGCL